jgi:tripartite-type tricarboxylate transporter receptor subunit TctC
VPHTHMTRRDLLALGLSLTAVNSAWAQPSSGPLTFIVHQPAGNPTDALARKLQPALQNQLKQTVVVENFPGAGGSLGVNRAIASGRDSATLIITSQTEPILTPITVASARYKAEDLRCLSLIGTGPYVLAGRPDLPVTTLQDLAAPSRRTSDKPLSFGHIGHGSMIHLIGEQLSRKLKGNFTFVPYKGVPPLVQDLIGGQIDLSFVPLAGPTANLIETGKIRAFGTTATSPSPRIPSLPLLSRLDPTLTDFVYSSWAAVFAPKATPAAQIEKFHAALAVATADAEFRAFIEAAAIERAEAMSLVALERFYQGEILTYRQLAKEIGIKPE